MRTPLVVVTGVDATAMDAALLALSWDSPRAVTVRHRIDADAHTLTRVVSDATGVLEHVAVDLEHACVDCALREDVLPTLERLARGGRWSTILAGLPLTMEADQLSTVLTRDARLARRLRLSSVLAAVAADPCADVLMSDDQLADRGLHTGPHDDRGLGEVACAQVELADAVVVEGDPGPRAVDLLRALARPGTPVVVGAERLDPAGLARGRHQHRQAIDWCVPGADTVVPPLGESLAWRLDLASPRPFHPERLLDRIESLGAGEHRSRGRFWLPTRPGSAQQWMGAGGQLSIGGHGPWGRRTPLTRLVLTGLGDPPEVLPAAFDDLLVTPEEALLDNRSWRVVEDGLEPWLGDVVDAA